MSTKALVANIEFHDHQKDILVGQLPFWARMKQKYFGTKERVILGFGALKLAVVIAVVKGKVIAAVFATQFPMTAAFLAKLWLKLVILAVGAMALVFGN